MGRLYRGTYRDVEISIMPSKTPKQRKLMSIAAHTPGGYGGVPQKVGKEFHSEDRGKYGAKTKSGKKKPKMK